MIARLFSYFGIIGSASIIAWLMALVLLVVFLRSRQRARFFLIALGLAVVGWVLAQINSRQVSDVRLETPAFNLQEPGEDLGTEAGVPAYRQQGKQTREAGKSAPLETTKEEKPERTFKEAELLEANRLDRWNLLFARGTLLLVLFALVADYLARFNRTTGGSYPLPVAGPWLDRLVPKSRTVLAGNLDLKQYLETIVRRGETFVYFTGTDPWSVPTLARLGRPLPKIVYGSPAEPEFYFDAAWFNRYCVVVPAADAPAVLQQLEVYLNWHHLTKATARQTVNIVWDLATPPAAELLAKLVPLFRETNFKLILKAPTANREFFDEVHA